MSDHWTIPHKGTWTIEKYDSDWTEEQIANGDATPAEVITYDEGWQEAGPDGPVPITDPARIAALDATIPHIKEED